MFACMLAPRPKSLRAIHVLYTEDQQYLDTHTHTHSETRRHTQQESYEGVEHLALPEPEFYFPWQVTTAGGAKVGDWHHVGVCVCVSKPGNKSTYHIRQHCTSLLQNPFTIAFRQPGTYYNLCKSWVGSSTSKKDAHNTKCNIFLCNTATITFSYSVHVLSHEI